MKQIEVTILGQSYVLGCPEGGEQSLLAAVAHVDKEMSAIRDAGKVKARERIAVLTALNLAYLLAERPPQLPVDPQSLRDSPPRGRATVLGRPGASGSGDDLNTPKSSVDLDTLIKRVDAAISDDGQLL